MTKCMFSDFDEKANVVFSLLAKNFNNVAFSIVYIIQVTLLKQFMKTTVNNFTGRMLPNPDEEQSDRIHADPRSTGHDRYHLLVGHAN